VFYTYIHLNKDNKPIYVGKGTGKRAYSKRDYKEQYTVKIVEDNVTEEQALDLEELLIAQIGIDNLYNKRPKGGFSKALKADYTNLKKQVASLSIVNKKRLAKVVIDDAMNGNVDAIREVFNRLGKSWQRRINNLLQLNTGDNVMTHNGVTKWQKEQKHKKKY
jgi:uncharacterized protein (DUF4415 family)